MRVQDEFNREVRCLRTLDTEFLGRFFQLQEQAWQEDENPTEVQDNRFLVGFGLLTLALKADSDRN